MLPAGTIIGGYRVVRELGRGTTAAVHVAESVTGASRVALKVAFAGTADDDVVRLRFLRGARAQAALTHPNIVPVLDVGVDPLHGPWLAMALADPTTLATLHARGELPAARALARLDEVAAGLDAAHAAGIVHRDVKPSNILIDGDRALLADFGLARDGEPGDATRTGAVIGTLPYLAPELVRGGQPSAASDRYALAAIAYELLVGEVVFPRPTDAAVLYAQVAQPPPRASSRRAQLPTAVDAVLARGLAKSEADRYPSAAQLIVALHAALGAAEGTLGPPAPRVDSSARTLDPPTGRRPTARRARMAALSVFVAAVAGAGLVALGPSDRGSAEAAAVPVVAPGHIALGSDLQASPARVSGRDCRDRAASGSTPACTVLQTELPGRRVVVPRSGAVRAWTVRGASGELVLQIMRRRDDKIFQLYRSQPVVVRDGGVHRFPATLPVEAGDVIGLAVLPGGQVGVVAEVAGARSERWFGPVGSDRGAGTRTGFRHELQLRVDVEPGATIPPPPQVTGTAARALAAGREVGAGDTLLPDRRRVRVALVELHGKVYVDLYRRGVRRARVLVPDLIAGGAVAEFRPYRSRGNPSQLNVVWRNRGTSSDIYHYFGLDAEELEYYS